MIIIYENNGIKLLIPCRKDIPIVEIGENDIDEGIAFWIVKYEDLPNTPQEIWKLENMGEPSGYGKRK